MTEEEIETALGSLTGWSRTDNKIERKLEFDSFMDAIGFINRIAELADAADHHPEIFNVYNRVELVLTTHDAGGLTQKDFDLASEINHVA